MTDSALPSGEKRFTLATNAVTGNNITLELSDEVNVDGTWLRMPSGYPRVEVQGSKQLFIFRFPRFAGSMVYDPIIDGAGTPAPPAPPPSPQPLPPSPAPSSEPSTPKVELSFTAAGTVDAFGEDEKAAIQQVVADIAGVARSAVT